MRTCAARLTDTGRREGAERRASEREARRGDVRGVVVVIIGDDDVGATSGERQTVGRKEKERDDVARKGERRGRAEGVEGMTAGSIHP